jgi:D-alanyl-D-alanine carboxypeptidase/D-alanyl-D-alanine-endopeptidase (penicillin-binding protein 4)
MATMGTADASGKVWGRPVASLAPAAMSAVLLTTLLTTLLTGCTVPGETLAVSPGGDGAPSGRSIDVGRLPSDARRILAKPEYRGARWLYRVSDLRTGEVLLASRPDELVFTGSTAKQFTVGTAYATLGPNATITTPVYATSPVKRGRLDGDLVLVGSGDLAMGGRGALQGRVDQAFTATTIDHIYADLAPNGAVVRADPLAGLNSLAAQVAESGIRRVDGDVVIDTRLWETYSGQEGPVPPIFINDNLLDITVTAAAVGQAATITTRPKTTAFTVVSKVRTAAGATPAQLSVDADPQNSRKLTVSGRIAEGASQLTIYRVPDAARWARTLFVEALERAGVRVRAAATASNDQSDLPAAGRYADLVPTASMTSPPLRKFGKMILLTSYNTGANAVLCLLAVGRGSTDCNDGLQSIRTQVQKAGLDSDQVFLVDGQGGDPASTTPTQMATWMTWARSQPWGDVLVAGQPVLGVSGTLASSERDSPARGKVAAKTGTSLSVDPATGGGYSKVQSLAGYLTTDEGRVLVLALSMSGGTYPDVLTALVGAADDVNAVAAAIQQAL